MNLIRLTVVAIALFCSALAGCQSASQTKLGIGERDWLRRTLVADLVYAEGSVKAYRSGGVYYYFKDGTLVKIDQGVIPSQRIEMDVAVRQQ